jgi:hypothetical protein
MHRRLDRIVAAAHVVRLLGWLGRVACIALAAAGTVAVVEGLLGARSLTGARLFAGVITALGALMAWRRAAGPAPSRLAVAAAAEAAYPHLGERLSRAIDFPADEATSDVSRGLRELSVAEAAQLLAGCARLPVPGLGRHGWWLTAGCAALLGLAMMRWRPPQTSTVIDADAHPATAAGEPRAADVAAAADAIASSAAIEARLTAMIDARFTRAPGVIRDDLPAAEQADLDRLAAIHADAAREILRGRTVVAALAATAPQARDAAGLLQSIDAAAIEAATADIGLHRLAAAAATTARVSSVLAAAARSLGVTVDEGGIALAAAAPLPARRMASALAEIDRRTSAAGQVPAAALAAAPPDAAQRQPPPTQPGSGPPPGERDQAAPAGGTTEPRFGTGADQTQTAVPPAARPAGRAWDVLPAAVRTAAARGGWEEVPPTYRQAVDRYYKSLLDSLTAESPPAASPSATRLEPSR